MSAALKKIAGFTLIELLLVIAMLGILLLGTITTLNPFAQFQKANDSTRTRDLKQIKTGLDEYYSDFGCYPRGLAFGKPWKVKQVTYMKKVPENVGCQSDGTNCYVYQNDASACPQWYTTYAKLDKAPINASCTLSSQSNCSPTDLTSSWACETGGQIDCALIQASHLSDGSTVPPSDIDQVFDDDAPTPTPIIVAPQHCGGAQSYVCAPTCNYAGYAQGTYCSSTCDHQCD